MSILVNLEYFVFFCSLYVPFLPQAHFSTVDAVMRHEPIVSYYDIQCIIVWLYFVFYCRRLESISSWDMGNIWWNWIVEVGSCLQLSFLEFWWWSMYVYHFSDLLSFYVLCRWFMFCLYTTRKRSTIESRFVVFSIF